MRVISKKRFLHNWHFFSFRSHKFIFLWRQSHKILDFASLKRKSFFFAAIHKLMPIAWFARFLTRARPHLIYLKKVRHMVRCDETSCFFINSKTWCNAIQQRWPFISSSSFEIWKLVHCTGGVVHRIIVTTTTLTEFSFIVSAKEIGLFVPSTFFPNGQGRPFRQKSFFVVKNPSV